VGQSVALESVCVMAVQCGELGRPVSVFSASHVDCWTVVWNHEFKDVINRNSEAEPGCDWQ
jgi:hypothetical protein